MDKRLKLLKMLLDNYILILLMFVITSYKGSNGFGFDSASSCSPNGKLSRRGRAQMIAAIPCDLTHQPYCNLPGAAYPWHAVRRFVHENQGLMKRMYGDVRHISVLRDEIRNNEIDIEDIEMAAERYSRSGSRRSSKYMHKRDEDYGVDSELKINDIVMEPNIPEITTTKINTLPFDSNSNIDDITTVPNKAMEAKTIQKNNENEAKKVEPLEKNDSQLKFDNKSTVNSTENGNKITNDDSNLTSNSVYELPTLTTNEFASPSTNGDNIEIIQSPKLNIELKNITEQTPTIPTTTLKVSKATTTMSPTTTTTITTTLSTKKPQTTTSTTITTKKVTTSSYIEAYRRRTQYTNRYRPIQSQQKLQQQLFRMNTTFFKTKENLLSMNLTQKVNESERISNTTTAPISVFNSTTSATVKNWPTITTTSIQAIQTPNGDNSPLISATQKGNILKINNQPVHINSPTEKTPITLATQSPTPPTPTSTKIELLSGEKLRKQPTTNMAANKASPNVPVTKPPVLRDGQLYQDTFKQEPAPAANIRGINACPVKEEVVAPFWANNTRGEVLALLNLYPFEQYVHWEKCTHEHKQMYCRDGCRCEQQYRLHRLLAYDPHNECRGIFSDWFRFPSCCICKCYNIPIEFRATSRSPRMQSFPDDEETINDADVDADAEDHRHPLEIAEEEVKRAIYEHATEEWYRPRDDYDYAED